MSGQRQPIDLVIAKGKKNLTKAEIEERRAREITPITDEIEPPEYLTTKKQREEFTKLANQLTKLRVMGETDVDALARYVISNELYVHTSKKLRSSKVKNNPYEFNAWSKVQDKYFKQCRAAALDLGLTISSRCKLVAPTVEEKAKPENKFAAFKKGAASG